jgi:hypothetical protein
MTAIALSSISRSVSSLQAFARFTADIVAGVREGHAIANRYEELSRLSDAALKTRGLVREDIARVAVTGRAR